MLIGFGVGYAVFGTRAPDLGAAAEVVQERLTEARGLLEVAAIEYREGAPAGSIANQPEYDAATRAVTRAQEAVEAVDAPLRALAPDRAAALEDGFGALVTLMGDVESPDAVDDAVEAQIELLLASPS